MKFKNELKKPEIAKHILKIASDISKTDPVQKSRTELNVMARYAVSVKLREEGETYAAIAKFLDKNHSSIIHYWVNHKNRMNFDRDYKIFYNKFTSEITNPKTEQQKIVEFVKIKFNDLNDFFIKIGYKDKEINDAWKQVVNQ